MNEYAKKLVAALRSGEYEQARGQLRVDDKFCCLGVACDIVRDELGLMWEKSTNGKMMLGELTSLPDKVRQLYGFSTEIGDFRRKDGASSALTELNDNGKTFAEIANVIESEPEGLFE